MSIGINKGVGLGGEGGGEGQSEHSYERWLKDPTPDEEKQALLIHAVFNGYTDFLSKQGAVVSEEQREEFLSWCSNWPDFASLVNALIATIKAPHEYMSHKDILREIKEFPGANFALVIIHYAGLQIFPDYNEEDLLDTILDEEFSAIPEDIKACTYSAPDVFKFIQISKLVISLIRLKFGEEEAQNYYDAYRVVAGLLYGEQLDYADQLRFLEQGARQNYGLQAQSKNYSAPKDNASERDRLNQYTLPSQVGVTYADVDGVSFGYKLLEEVGERDPKNPSVSRVVDKARLLGYIPIVVNYGGVYLVYHAPCTYDYLKRLKSDGEFAQGQVRVIARGLGGEVKDLYSKGNSNKSPTQIFNLTMQRSLHPDSAHWNGGTIYPGNLERSIRGELFKTYKVLVQTNQRTEFYGLV